MAPVAELPRVGGLGFLGQADSRTAGGIDFSSVVDFDDFHIEVGSEALGGMADEFGEHLNSQAEVGGPQYGNLLAESLEGIVRIRIEPGGARNQGKIGGAYGLDEGLSRGCVREVHDDIGSEQRGREVISDENADGLGSVYFSQVQANVGGIRSCDGPDDGHVGLAANREHGGTHAACGTVQGDARRVAHATSVAS